MTTITIRIDDKIKQEVKPILNKMGLSLSAAITLFLVQVIDKKGIPFSIDLKSILIEEDNEKEYNI